VVERRKASAPCKARAAAEKAAAVTDQRLSAFRFPFLLVLQSWLKAKIVTAPAPTAGVV
jgi:hypothetical protein